MKSAIIEAAEFIERESRTSRRLTRSLTVEGYREKLCNLAQRLRATVTARPLIEWHEDDGDVLWWKLPVAEAPWVGSPLDSGWPGYHTHWTPLPAPPFTEVD